MEPFSISCTTCQARLKVRDAGAVGQSCRSKVWQYGDVEQPANATDSTPQAEPQQPAGGVPPTILAAESFDAIDQLLDDAPPTRAKVDDRWRSSDPTSELAEAAPDVAAQPSESTAQDESVQLDSATESVSAASDWMSSSAIAARKYAFLIGGVAIGAGIAVVVAGYLFTLPGTVTRTTPSAAQPAGVAEDSNDKAETVEQPSDDSDPLEAPAAPLNPDVEPAQVEVVPDDEPPSVAEPTDLPAEPDAVVTNTDETPLQPENPPTRDTDTKTIDLGDDGLAGFAQWLQDKEAAPADRPMDPTPTPDSADLLPPPPAAGHVTRQTRPIPEKVDVETRLKDELIALEFKRVTLNNALRTLSEFSTIPISVDPDALGRLNLTADHEVNLLVRDKSTVRDVLTQMLKKLRLDYYIADGHLFISTPAECEAEFVTLPHEVSDLASGGEENVKEFGDWIQQLVAQGTWSAQNGQGKCRVVGSKLQITHFDTVHYQVLAFCERLRLVRGQKPITRLRPEHMAPGLRANSLRASGTPVSLKIWRESNLGAIAAAFERAAEMQVLIDWHALHSAGWSPQDTMTFFCINEPVEQAMTSLLEPMGLTYRVVNPITIEISTFEALEAQHEVEFYPLPANATNEEMQQISRRIMQRVGQAKFQPAGRGAIGFDTNSHSLIVSLPQHDQAVVHAMLSRDAVKQPSR